MTPTTVVPAPAPEPIAAGPLVGSLALASVLAPLNSTMVSVALPAMASSLGVDAAALTLWVVTSYVLVSIVCQSPGGKLGDLFGHRSALRVGQTIFAAGSAAGLLATGVAGLAGARMLMAAGGAMIAPSAMALVRTELPAERRSQAYGTLGAVLGVAAALGPVVGGELVARLGWRAIFLVNAVPLGLSLATMRRAHASARPSARPSFDLVGSALLAAGLLLLVLALRAGVLRGLAFGAASGVVLVGFAWWERRAASPVVDLALFRHRALAAGCAIIGLQNVALYGLLFELPFVLAGPLRADAATSGRTILPLMLMLVAFSPVSGRLALRIGARATVLTGTLLSITGMLWLALHRATRASELLPPLLIIGAGAGLAPPPCQASAMSTVQPAQSGMAAAILTSGRCLGGVVGIAVLGATLAGQGASASVAAHRVSLWIFTAALGLSAIACVGLPGRATR